MGVSLFFIVVALLGRNLSGFVLFLIIFAFCVLLTEFLWKKINRKMAGQESVENNSKEKSL
jgi:hypothetical protein